jgi:hypothetical protein
MTGKSAPTFGKTAKIPRLILMAAMLLIMASLSCKEKTQAPAATPKAAGTCEVFDKLPGDIAKPGEVNFGNKVKLLGISVNKESQTQLKIINYWQVLEDLGPYYNRVYVIFADKNDKQLFGHEHDFCLGRPFAEIKGKFLKEIHTVGIPPSAVGNRISVGIGIFAPEIKTDGSRLKIESSGEIPLVDNNTRAIVAELNL